MDALMAHVNETHEAIPRAEINLTPYLSRETKDPVDYNDYFVDDTATIDNFDATIIMSQQDIQTDTELFFDILKNLYGLYDYFGGDAVFDVARDAILADCATHETLKAPTYGEILAKHLSFIKDQHFQIRPLNSLSYPRINGNIYAEEEFYKSGDGYVNKEGLRVAEIEGHSDLDKLFKLALTQDGRIVYQPIVLSEDKPILIVEYTDESTAMLSPGATILERAISINTTVDVHETEGYPVILSTKMWFYESEDPTQKEGGKTFLDAAQTYKDAPVLILDLRYNGGGNGLMPGKWLEILTGSRVNSNNRNFIRGYSDDWWEEDHSDYSTYTSR